MGQSPYNNVVVFTLLCECYPKIEKVDVEVYTVSLIKEYPLRSNEILKQVPNLVSSVFPVQIMNDHRLLRSFIYGFGLFINENQNL